ncbi:MAG: electron transfer flavoprotein subunit alpha/FixB family protein [Acidobacteriaceae bacterium]|nr:electron transfer flavoprotein subunit alpha/FixB family protein [Acidobacteriaceae bacterium]
MSILVVTEHRAGTWNRLSFEALAAAQKLAKELDVPVDAVAIGSGIDSLAAELTQYPIRTPIVIDDPVLSDYTPDAYAAALEQLIKAENPRIVVFPHTYQVRDFAPKLAARFLTSVVSDVVDLKSSPSGPVYVRQLFQGKLNADVHASGEPQFVSVQAGAFRAANRDATATNPVRKFPVQIDPATVRSKPEQPFREAQRSVDLGAADIIVAVGRGIKEKDNLPIVEELAQQLGAEIAASRPICDNGWLPMERQVGSSGQTVAPKIYFAIGISGAIQHLVGMKGSRTIVAINKDESAPIFEAADYGIVGDLFEIVPALTEEIRKTKA